MSRGHHSDSGHNSGNAHHSDSGHRPDSHLEHQTTHIEHTTHERLHAAAYGASGEFGSPEQVKPSPCPKPVPELPSIEITDCGPKTSPSDSQKHHRHNEPYILPIPGRQTPISSGEVQTGSTINGQPGRQVWKM